MEKFAFLFPGQGTQFVQMGKYFYDSYLIAKQTFEEASEAAGKNIAKLCLESKASEINAFDNMQLAVVTTEVAIFRAYMEDYGISPQFIMGHSIGEYAALVCAGAVAFSDIIHLLLKRSTCVNEVLARKNSRMTVIEKTNIEDIQKAIANVQNVYISCYNSKSQYAISGMNDEMDEVEKIIIEKGGTVSPLFYSPPLHSFIMQDVKAKFSDAVASLNFYPLRFPLLSNITGKPIMNEKKIAALMSDHLVMPVLWLNAMQFLPKYGITATIEMGTKALTTKFIQEDHPDIKTFCYGVSQDRQRLDELINSDSNYNKDKPNFIGSCLKIIAATPNHNRQPEASTKTTQVYNELKQLYISIMESKFGIRKEQIRESAEKLIQVLEWKSLRREEIKQWIKILLDETNTFYELEKIYQSL